MSQTRPTTRRRPAPAAVAGPASPRLGLALLVIATAQLMVLLDATIIRMVLVPAFMHLMGRWNWWPGHRGTRARGPGTRGTPI